VADDDVVGDEDPQEVSGRSQAFGHLAVLGARLGVARRMVVNQDDLRGTGTKCGLEDLGRSNRDRVASPPSDLEQLDASPSLIEHERPEGLLAAVP
jgi:hypothetical protein